MILNGTTAKGRAAIIMLVHLGLKLEFKKLELRDDWVESGLDTSHSVEEVGQHLYRVKELK